MGKAAELSDYVAMFIDKFLIADEFGKQGNGLVLQTDILRMHEWHIEERPLLLGQLLIELQINRLFSNLLREMIGGKGVGAIAEHIARKLVEEDDRGERGFRRA